MPVVPRVKSTPTTEGRVRYLFAVDIGAVCLFVVLALLQVHGSKRSCSVVVDKVVVWVAICVVDPFDSMLGGPVRLGWGPVLGVEVPTGDCPIDDI